MDISLSPIGAFPSALTTARVSAAVSPIGPGESSNPTHVSAAVSPIGPGESSKPTYVSAAVSPIPLNILDFLPFDFPSILSKLVDDSEDEPDLIYKTPPHLTRVIASDRGPEKEEIGVCKPDALVHRLGVKSPETEIISETEPESD